MTYLHILQMAMVPLTVFAFAFLNRAAGNRLFGFCKRGKPAVYVAPIIGLFAWYWNPWQQALAWAGTYLEWRIWKHGRWIDLKNDPSDLNRIGIKRDWFERYCEYGSFGLDVIALFWRHMTILPGFIAVWLTGGSSWLLWIGIPTAALLAGCHALAKRLFPSDFHWFAEGLHGALFAAILVGSSIC